MSIRERVRKKKSDKHDTTVWQTNSSLMTDTTQFFFQTHSMFLRKLLFTSIDDKCTKSTFAQTVNGKESYCR